MHQPAEADTGLRISALYVYPVKSLAGIAVDAFRLSDRGPEHDRRWMLVDADGRFLTQREHPRLALFTTAIEGDTLVIGHRHHPDDRIQLPLRPKGGDTLRVQVWDDALDALHPSAEASERLSLRLGVTARLVHMPDAARRPVDPDYALRGDLTSLSDGYPLLIIGQSSLDDLNARLAEPVTMERFRPNIVFTGGGPYREDRLSSFRIGGGRFHGVKPCARCVLTTVDPRTGATGPEPLRTLAGYRTRHQKVYFGMNLLFEGAGEVRVGDALVG